MNTCKEDTLSGVSGGMWDGVLSGETVCTNYKPFPINLLFIYFA